MRKSRSLAVGTGRHLLSALFLLACAGARNHGDGAPVLERVTPDSVFVPIGGVVEVTLIGSGFRQGVPGENTVLFGRSTMRDVPASADGKQIRFVVPDEIESGGEAPPSRLSTGSYPVQVETPAGKSNVLMLRVYR